MELARSTASTLKLDPKRIAATSVAIAVHVLVLMVLMLPVQMAAVPLVEETPMVVVPLVKKIEPPIPPPVRRVVRQTTVAPRF